MMEDVLLTNLSVQMDSVYQTHGNVMEWMTVEITVMKHWQDTGEHAMGVGKNISLYIKLPLNNIK